MTATKTNERPGTRAQVRHVRMSAYKAREVLDLVRGMPVDEARAVLAYTERAAAEVVGKCLESAVANAEHNDEVDPETLFVTSCFADEGRTLYRYRPRARGRATKIRKRTCHITVIVAPMPPDMLAQWQAKVENIPGSRAARRRGQEAASRAERVAKSQAADTDADEADEIAGSAAEAAEAEGIVDTTAEAAEVADEVVAEAETAADEPAADETETAADETAVADDTETEAVADDQADEEEK